LENQLNSRIHTTGLFNLDSRHHPLAVDWRVEVWHFLFQLPCKGFDVFILYWRVFQRTVSTDKTLFICKAGLTPHDVSDINNYPCSYSFND
jgi:hypothetical protein